MNFTNFINSFRTLLLALVLSIGISYSYAAWSPPSTMPTGGNAEAPVNVGGATQVKSGALTVNGLLTAVSNVGIGASSLASWEKLKVNGVVSISGADPDGYSALITSESSGLPLRLKSRAGNAPDLVVATDGNIGIGDSSPDGSLKLDVEGQVGATEYCDQNGGNCTPATALGGGGGAQSLTQNGYATVGGLIIQWGTISLAYTGAQNNNFGGAAGSATFPIPFPTAVLNAVVSIDAGFYGQSVGVSGLSNTTISVSGNFQYNVNSAPNTARYIAIGH